MPGILWHSVRYCFLARELSIQPLPLLSALVRYHTGGRVGGGGSACCLFVSSVSFLRFFLVFLAFLPACLLSSMSGVLLLLPYRFAFVLFRARLYYYYCCCTAVPGRFHEAWNTSAVQVPLTLDSACFSFCLTCLPTYLAAVGYYCSIFTAVGYCSNSPAVVAGVVRTCSIFSLHAVCWVH